jgi:subtilisin family serine protease
MRSPSIAKLLKTGLVAAAVAAGGLATPATAGAAAGKILGTGADGTIEGSYVVVFKDGVSASATSVAARHNAKVTHTYRAALHGYAATMSEADAKRTAADPAVAYVEQNRVVSALETQPNPPSWGLDRVDQRTLPLNSGYTYPNPGTGVTAYIIDTGIRTTHGDFGGRARWGTNTVDTNNTDCNGHGTHVAGTVGGTAHGVAKNVKLVAVKVLNCQGSGTLAGVAQGIDWVTANAAKPAVANMSLGASGTNVTMENAVRNSIGSGVTYAIASGNSGADACDFTPTRSRRSRTSVRAPTSSPRAATSPRPGTPATPRRTRSAARRWRPRTWPVLRRCTWARTRRRPRPPCRPR